MLLPCVLEIEAGFQVHVRARSQEFLWKGEGATEAKVDQTIEMNKKNQVHNLEGGGGGGWEVIHREKSEPDRNVQCISTSAQVKIEATED